VFGHGNESSQFYFLPFHSFSIFTAQPLGCVWQRREVVKIEIGKREYKKREISEK
jgi:pyruvate-formate lyase-activating enzyme